MSGQPDPKPARREKRPRRTRDPKATKTALLRDRECWGCGHEGSNGHHLIPKDFTKPGPDVGWNTIALCGSGTSGCHGAFHGNPYTRTITADPRSITQFAPHEVRITAEVVRAHIVLRLGRDRDRLREVVAFLGPLWDLYATRVLYMADDEAAAFYKLATRGATAA